jgi:exosortase E/protease (VPEID-CTERM system)
LLLELLGASYAFDTMDLRGKGRLGPALLRVLPWLVRGGVAFGVAGVLFGWRRLSGLGEARGRWHAGWLAAHVAAALGFAVAGRALFWGSPGGGEADGLVAAVLLLGAGAAASLGLGLVAAEAWREAWRRLGAVVWVALGAAGLAMVGGYFAQRLWWPASVATFEMVRWLLGLALPVVVAKPEQFLLGSERFPVIIDPGCSGYEGLALMLAFTSAWLWWFRSEYRFPAALALIPGALAAVFLLNSVRIAALILIGDAGAPGVALGGFHSQAGWISFNAVAIGFCLVSRRIQWVRRERVEKRVAQAEENPVAPYLIPFLAILAAGMLAKSVSAGFEYLYGLRVVAAGLALWWYRAAYRRMDWRVSWAAPVAGLAVLAIWMARNDGGAVGMPAELAAMAPGWRWVWVALRVAGTAVTVPVAEELAFRGFLSRRLVDAEFERVRPGTWSWVAVAGSSVAFGLMHGGQWAEGVAAGVVYWWAYRWRGSVGDAALAHGLTNAGLAAAVAATGRWGWL